MRQGEGTGRSPYLIIGRLDLSSSHIQVIPMYDIMMSLCKKYYNEETFSHAKAVEGFICNDCRYFLLSDENKLITRTVALGHDLLEDTTVSLSEFVSTIQDDRIINAILLLTHKKNTPYKEYVKNIMTSDNIYAKLVKTADMADHLSRIETLTPRLKKKYKEVLKYFL